MKIFRIGEMYKIETSVLINNEVRPMFYTGKILEEDDTHVKFYTEKDGEMVLLKEEIKRTLLCSLNKENNSINNICNVCKKEFVAEDYSELCSECRLNYYSRE